MRFDRPDQGLDLVIGQDVPGAEKSDAVMGVEEIEVGTELGGLFELRRPQCQLFAVAGMDGVKHQRG